MDTGQQAPATAGQGMHAAHTIGPPDSLPSITPQRQVVSFSPGPSKMLSSELLEMEQ